VIDRRIRQWRFTLRGQDPVTFEDGADIVWMVRRERFDRFLLDQAERAGAELHYGRPASAVTLDGAVWTVATPQGPIRGRYLVAADGAKGPCSRWLGLRPGSFKVAAAIELESSVPAAAGAPLQLDFGAVPFGYLWNFPKADGQSLGIASLKAGPGMDLKGQAEAYAAGFGIDRGTCRVAAHPIHVWNGDQLLHSHRALLAGEAASAVDPFTLEGIRPAISTGLRAAEAIQAALAGREEALAGYSERLRGELGGQLVWARRLTALFFRMPALAYRTALMNERGPRAMAQLVRGELAYAEVARRALARLSASWVGARGSVAE
jgi:flavin-dependent dehydrogenase